MEGNSNILSNRHDSSYNRSSLGYDGSFWLKWISDDCAVLFSYRSQRTQDPGADFCGAEEIQVS